MHSDDELLDLVDQNDNVIGTINRKDYSQLLEGNLGYIRAAQMYVINAANEIFVPIRTANKTIAPNGFDYSAGGHVGTGDTYEEALVRETKEELYMDVITDDLEFIAKVREDEIKYINCIYILRSDDTPQLNPEDFVSAEWLKPSELIAKIDAGHPTKDSLRRSTELLQEYLAEKIDS